MGSLNKRKPFPIGSSKAITLPKSWLDFHGKEATKELTLLGDSILIVAPKGLEEKAKQILKNLESRGDDNK